MLCLTFNEVTYPYYIPLHIIRLTPELNVLKSPSILYFALLEARVRSLLTLSPGCEDLSPS